MLNTVGWIRDALTKKSDLRPTEIDFLSNLIENNPDIFNPINEILLDNEINYHDIPNIILLLFNIYQKFISMNIKNVHNVRILNLIYFTITTILTYANITNIERNIAMQLINSCIELLKTELPCFEEVTCFPCWC